MGSVIWINPEVTELAAGYQEILSFLSAMRLEWLPGFERAFQRRSAEYQKALAKYEQRGFFLKTLLGKPKQPGRMPDYFPAQTETRLWQGWQEAIRAADVDPSEAGLNLASGSREDELLGLPILTLVETSTPLTVVIGQAGVLITEGGEQALALVRAQMDAPAWQRAPVQLGGTEVWPAAGAPKVLNSLSLYELADRLLARHQELSRCPTFSARLAAEKLAAQEKNGLLRMAATL